MRHRKLILGLAILLGTFSNVLAQKATPSQMDQSPGTQIAAAASRTTIHPAALKRASREVLPPGTTDDVGPINAIATHEPRLLQKISY
jgi:hypothetical protein